MRFFCRNNTITMTEVWLNENPLCALANSSNIHQRVNSGAMMGWDCSGMQPQTNYCDGSWTGVTCYAGSYPANTSVKTLVLPGLQLNGSLPTQMFGLYYLTRLDIAHN